MRLSKDIFWISVIITIICLIVSIILSFKIELNNFTNYINSIIQNILAGTIVLVLTSFAEYHYAKQDALEELIFELKRINDNYLYNLRFWDYRDYPTKDKYKINYKKLYTGQEEIPFSEKELDKMYNESLDKYTKKQAEDFNIIIKQYIDISKYDMDIFWLKYRKISFLLDFNNKERNKIYDEIFCYWQNIMKEIKDASFHFNEYLNSKHGNYNVNKDILIKLQNKIFCFEENEFRGEFTINDQNSDICSWGEDNIRGTCYIVGNKTSKYLRDCTNDLIKLTYSKI